MATIEQLFKKNFESSINVNKKIIQEHGTIAAVLLGELISKQKYYTEKNRLSKGSFFWSIRDMQRETGIKRRSIEKAVAKLKDADLVNVVSVKYRATWYSVNIKKVMDHLDATVLHTAQFDCDEEATVSPITQDCVTDSTATVSPVAHNNPINNPNNPNISTDESSKEVEPNLKDIVSLYYQLIEKATGEKPIYQWARDCSVLKKAADGQVMAQGEDKVRVKLEAWFANDNNGFLRSKGYPLALFAAQYNNIVTGSNRVNDLPNYTGASDRMLYGGKDVYL